MKRAIDSWIWLDNAKDMKVTVYTNRRVGVTMTTCFPFRMSTCPCKFDGSIIVQDSLPYPTVAIFWRRILVGEHKSRSLRTIRRLYMKQYLRCEHRTQALALPHLEKPRLRVLAPSICMVHAYSP